MSKKKRQQCEITAKASGLRCKNSATVMHGGKYVCQVHDPHNNAAAEGSKKAYAARRARKGKPGPRPFAHEIVIDDNGIAVDLEVREIAKKRVEKIETQRLRTEADVRDAIEEVYTLSKADVLDPRAAGACIQAIKCAMALGVKKGTGEIREVSFRVFDTREELEAAGFEPH